MAAIEFTNDGHSKKMRRKIEFLLDISLTLSPFFRQLCEKLLVSKLENGLNLYFNSSYVTEKRVV